MLYQDKALGRQDVWARVAARLSGMLSTRRQADQELLSLSTHLQRDVGVYDGSTPASGWDYVWRK